VTNSNYNGLEKTLALKVLERERRWQLAEVTAVYDVNDESFPQTACLLNPDTRYLKPYIFTQFF